MRLPLLTVLPLFLTGCVVDLGPSGPTQHDVKVIELDKSELVKVDLHMGVGELKVEGGSKKLMEGDFTYNVPSWKPEVRYSNTGVRGYLTVEQPSGSGRLGNNQHYEWNLRLNDEIPTDMRVKFGVGEARLNLGSLSLRSLEVEIGVGEIKVDLRGDPKRDYDVHIRGGVGEATVHLPQNVGIYADASGGIGGINVRGLHKEGGHYVNDGYEKAKVKVHLDVRGGIGGINLIAE